MEPAHEESYKGINITINYDDQPFDPREDCEPLGTMICFHSRHNLGDEHNYSTPDDFETGLACEIDPTVEDRIDYWDNLYGYIDSDQYNEKHDASIHKALKKAILLPLYLYDHSGITMRCLPFSCQWDSGQVGWIYITHTKIRKEYGWKKLTKERIEKVTQYLINEVESYDDYLTGSVYGYVCEDSEHVVDDESCWGFLGDSGKHENWYVLQEAKAIADWMAKTRDEFLTSEIINDVHDEICQTADSFKLWEKEIGDDHLFAQHTKHSDPYTETICAFHGQI